MKPSCPECGYIRQHSRECGLRPKKFGEEKPYHPHGVNTQMAKWLSSPIQRYEDDDRTVPQ